MSIADAGGLGAGQTHTGFAGSNNLFDFDKLSLTTPGSLPVLLNGLGGNADLQLLDSSKKILQSLAALGTSPISIDNLGAGNYSSGDTNYKLNVTVNLDPLTGAIVTGGSNREIAIADPLTGKMLQEANLPAS